MKAPSSNPPVSEGARTETFRESSIMAVDPVSSYSHAHLLPAMVKAIRLKQAPKNLFVFAALVFAGKLFDRQMLILTIAAFILFTLAAGSVYLLNDILDVEQDRQHPTKCRRPIASGALPVGVAWH